ncbi:hypothetical protein HE1_00197 [Holospora elegans E1]|uniref:Transposase DDE domain-containing protein n=1 Tax=Holospora elegans E1 TaxID=1427503 RepID=A0A023DWV1_9PROT|nr:hypothetical protein HE1_00197 [Holospora elegans E1]
MAILPTCWIVERRFAWLNHFRRVSKDCEIAIATAENMSMIVHSMILLRKLAKSCIQALGETIPFPDTIVI